MRMKAIGLILLAACADIEEDPRYQIIADACEDGDANACAQMMMLERQTEQANQQAWQNVADTFDGLRHQPPGRTQCWGYGNSMTCTHH